MKAVVVYEAMFGNTHHVATAIGNGLSSHADVVIVPIDRATAELIKIGCKDL